MQKSLNPGNPFYSWGNWGSEKENNLPKVPPLGRSRAGNGAGPADIRALPPPQGACATYRGSSTTGHTMGDILFTCQSLGLPACEHFKVGSSFSFVPTLLLHRKYSDSVEVHWEGHEFAHTLPHSAAKCRNQGLGGRKEDGPTSPCHYCSSAPSGAAREWLTQLPGPSRGEDLPQPCLGCRAVM